jgi:hypothetical protein
MCKAAQPGVLGFLPPLGRVAEWQTRTVQVRVSVRTWGFNSPLAHSLFVSAESADRGGLGFCFWGATPQTPTVLAPSDPALGALGLDQRPLGVFFFNSLLGRSG